jgi:very-short-patch-repair endonuclease
LAAPRAKKAKKDAAKPRTRLKKGGGPSRFTSETARAARRKVSSASCARNGAKGARATIAKHGFDFFFERWREWKLKKPSGPERQMIDILDGVNARYERDWRIGESYFTLDFYLVDLGRGVEVHGRIHKTLEVDKRAKNDARKRALLKDLGIDVLWIDDQDLEDADALTAKVRGFIQGA